MDWRLRRATPDDAPALAMIAAATFLETFAGIIAGRDMIAHCSANSSVEKFAGWAADPASRVTIAEHPHGFAPIGYTVLVQPDLPIEIGESDIELRRIYTLSPSRGTGLGNALMAVAVADARMMGKTRLLLGVLDSNHRARAFYERQGFVLAGARRFRVGDFMHDDVIYALGV